MLRYRQWAGVPCLDDSCSTSEQEDMQRAKSISANYSSVLLTFSFHSLNIIAYNYEQGRQHITESAKRSNANGSSRNTEFGYVFRKLLERETEVYQTDYPLECVSECECERWCGCQYGSD